MQAGERRVWAVSPGCPAGPAPGRPSRRPRGIGEGPSGSGRAEQEVGAEGCGPWKGAWVAFREKGGRRGWSGERGLWFMFETSFWLLCGDRNVGGARKPAPLGTGPALVFGKESCMYTLFPSAGNALRPWQGGGGGKLGLKSISPSLVTGARGRAHCLPGWLEACLLPLRRLPAPGNRSALWTPLGHWHTAAPHLRQAAHQTRNSLPGALGLGSCHVPKPSHGPDAVSSPHAVNSSEPITVAQVTVSACPGLCGQGPGPL